MSAVIDRPAEFDQRVMQYLPGLRKLSWRYCRDAEEREDLVNDTVMFALRNWQSFREEGGFWSWLCWQMRGEVSRRNNYNKRRVWLNAQFDVQHETADAIAELRTEPTQDVEVELADVKRLVAGVRHGDVLLRYAHGATLDEIARDRGLSKERIRQFIVVARKELEARS